MIKKKRLMILIFFCALSGIYFLPAQEQKENAEVLSVQNAIAGENLSWQAAETSMSRLSDPERRMRLGGRLADVAPRIPAQKPAPTSLPAVLDWRNHNGNWVTSIKDQGSCGSCWAFATTAVLESMVKISKNLSENIDLSEQMLLSCSGAGNCIDGGYDSMAAEYIKDTGIPRESCYPYTANDAPCNPCSGWMLQVVKIKSWGWVNNSITGIEIALQNGPVTTFMTVYSDFYYYSGGIYKVTAGATEEGGHLVTIIGYDHPNGYWICKNSWGTDWGEEGFFRIQMGQADTGLQNLCINQPIIDNDPPDLQAITDSSAEEGQLFSLTLNAYDADDDPITYSCLNLPTGATVDANSGVFSWTPTYTQSGIYDLNFAASDGIGETVKTGKITVKNVKRKQW
ncbi:MAG: C1 family peptidase [Chrysiogenales bacterium]